VLAEFEEQQLEAAIDAAGLLAPDRQPDDDRTPSSGGPVLRLGLARQLGLDQVGEHVAHVPEAGGEHALDRVLQGFLLER
jgi:hypothetical protein